MNKDILNSRSLSSFNFSYVFASALIIRLIYHFLGFEDYWGDAHHSVIISELTVNNDWIYSDYKGREVVWLPSYRYLATFFMFLFDHYNLIVAHFLNTVLGSLAAWLVSIIVFMETADRIASFWSGIILALLPWHVAFSHMNMSECLCGLLLISAVLSIQRKLYLLLFLSIFVGVLTRNEMTYLFSLLLIWLAYKRSWKEVFIISAGMSIGLTLWAIWCWHKTGYPLWWIATRVYGSTRDAAFNGSGEGTRPIWIVITSLLQAFPLVLIMLFYKNKPLHNNSSTMGILKVLAFGHWISVFVLQFKFFSHPDPHYFVISLPIAVTLFGIGFSNRHKVLRIGVLTSLVALLALIPTFYFLPYTNIHAKKMGMYIKDNDLNTHSFLNDFPVAYYHSGIDVKKNFSTDQALGFDRGEINKAGVASFIKNNSITYVIAQDVAFSNALSIWPEMKEKMTFEWQGLTFSPVYTFDANFPVNNFIDEMVLLASQNRSTSTLWKIMD